MDSRPEDVREFSIKTGARSETFEVSGTFDSRVGTRPGAIVSVKFRRDDLVELKLSRVYSTVEVVTLPAELIPPLAKLFVTLAVNFLEIPPSEVSWPTTETKEEVDS